MPAEVPFKPGKRLVDVPVLTTDSPFPDGGRARLSGRVYTFQNNGEGLIGLKQDTTMADQKSEGPDFSVLMRVQVRRFPALGQIFSQNDEGTAFVVPTIDSMNAFMRKRLAGLPGAGDGIQLAQTNSFENRMTDAEYLDFLAQGKLPVSFGPENYLTGILTRGVGALTTATPDLAAFRTLANGEARSEVGRDEGEAVEVSYTHRLSHAFALWAAVGGINEDQDRNRRNVTQSGLQELRKTNVPGYVDIPPSVLSDAEEKVAGFKTPAGYYGAASRRLSQEPPRR